MFTTTPETPQVFEFRLQYILYPRLLEIQHAEQMQRVRTNDLCILVKHISIRLAQQCDGMSGGLFLAFPCSLNGACWKLVTFVLSAFTSFSRRGSVNASIKNADLLTMQES